MSRLADVDADGKLDLVSLESAPNRVAVALGRGDGTFQAAAYYAVDTDPISLDVGDLDGDADRDIVVGSGTTSSLSILRNGGTGTFAAATSLTVSTARSVVIAKIDADNRPDLVVASGSTNTVSIVLATATGYAAPVVYSLGFTVMSAAAGDLDNDGDLDLAAVGKPYSAAILQNAGNGTFSIAAATPLTGDGNDVTIADFDADGKRDIAVATSTRVVIYGGTGAATFSGSNELLFNVAKGITSGDLDNDGKPDVVAVGGDGLALITRGPNTYSLRMIPLELPDYSPERVAVGDFDNDGRIDVVTSSTSNLENGVLVLRNTGMVPTHTLIGSGQTYAGVISDLDGDGRNDFVRVVPGSFQVYMQVNGSLVTDGTQYTVTGAIGVGDVSVDGISDIVVSAYMKVSVFRGLGGGRFAPMASYPVDGLADEVHVVNLDGHCAPEIVLVHPNIAGGSSANTIGVMRNRGNGTFDSESHLSRARPHFGDD